LKGDEEPVALDLHPEQIGAPHRPSVDALLVIADHLVNGSQILSKQLTDTCGGDGSPVTRGYTPGKLLKVQGILCLGFAQACIRELQPCRAFPGGLNRLANVGVVFCVVREVEIVRPGP
jgi:hypothetical protein